MKYPTTAPFSIWMLRDPATGEWLRPRKGGKPQVYFSRLLAETGLANGHAGPSRKSAEIVELTATETALPPGGSQ